MQNNQIDEHKVSSLGKTWILDLDGTIVKHNGYKIDGHDSFLIGAKEFLEKIPKEDMIIFVTSRSDEYIDMTKKFLADNKIHYNAIIHNAPFGERILINDAKPSGLKMAIAVSPRRDEFMNDKFLVDYEL